MTATSEGQHRTKRSKGFTIDSIIGRDTDSRSDGHTSPSEYEHVLKTPESSRIGDISHKQSELSDPNRDRTSHRRDGDQGTLEQKQHFDNERLRRKDSFHHNSAIENGNIQRTVSSLHRDAVRDLSFTSSRDGLQSTPSSETLKHFHETLLQNAAAQPNPAMNLSMAMPFGHFDAQRHCRHPLSGINIPGYPSPLPAHPQLHPGVLLNGAARDLRQMYPYIADRYPGYFHPRFGLGGMPGLFFQPYRKPKRIRTAFSPSQLLQLEKSFEKSHYVVGQERKDLANELQLSETQVKVWFQNRRTKYKRTKAEQDGGPGERGEPSSPCHESNEESDISDIDDIDDVGNEYCNTHAYPTPIQTC